MTKRIIALLLCLVSVVALFAGCAGSIDPTSEYKGQQITMYLAETVYDLDPANAYYNESTRSIVSLLFDTLFVLDEKGKVKESLAKKYTIDEDDNSGEYYMYIELKDTNWSDNTPVTADDVVYAWKRVLSYNNSFEAAALLFDIKGARDYNAGEVSEDDIGLTADGNTVTIQFEQPIDYDQFLLNLTSLALAPLREDIVGKGEDWAKKPGTMVCSGPFKLARISFSKSTEKYSDINYDVPHKVDEKNTVYLPATESKKVNEYVVNNFVIERNAYYYRDSEEDQKLDVSVLPYRIIVDCAMSDEDIKEAYDKGALLYMGDIPMSLRNDFKDTAETKASLSTNVIYFNQNAEISGEKLFANKTVRQALSMAINRTTIANDVVFAEAATGLVPTGVFDTNSAKSLFRDNASGNYQYLNTNVESAKQMLDAAGITNRGKYEINITYAAYDEVHAYIAESVAAAWTELGFDVKLNKRGTVINNDYYKHTNSVPEDICDDVYAEDLRSGAFEVIILDLVAPSVDPFSILAPFAKSFSGQQMDMSVADNYELTPHITGYDSEEYNALMETIYNEKNISNRSANLHKAEEILMEDLPVVPVIFNETAYVVNEGLKLNNKTLWWKKSSNYYGADTLKNVEVKDYEEYLTTYSSFLESKFAEYQENSLSYFGGESYRSLTWEEFKEESSNYIYLWKVYEKNGNKDNKKK